ncbi:hypothetical protein BJ322DRAFT_849234 [Thelephora terrestris]|uniref:Uncharacterized protein n=1 Tax=Thelephora terrestris TaxID=56493 RepID=A0A9P6HDB4_9AGAM|nr:hypothetical protein BJ322DRAFT_849234 [Thelephora terrestris]
MKGHNALHPCRFCEILGIRIEGGNIHYVPLYRPEGSIDPANLPMRSHDKFLKQGASVLEAPTNAAAERLAKDSGIKGVSLLASLNTLNFPFSFPLDFMHLIFENLIPNLVRHYTGTFKELDSGVEDYKLSGEVWSEICKAGSETGDTIPSSFGSRMPNIETERSHMTAEAWAFWSMYLAPILLRNRFSRRRYYDHFIKLVRLIHTCISFELKRSEVEGIRKGFQEWVLEYEEIFYQKNLSRMSACPVTIHGLLHIADGIEATGPVWAAWAFVMERYCGWVKRSAVRSRKHALTSIDNRVLETTQLEMAKMRYGLTKKLSLKPKRGRTSKVKFSNYPEYAMLDPKRTLAVDAALTRQLIDLIVTRCSPDSVDRKIPAAVARKYVPRQLTEWGGVQIHDTGDRANGRAHRKPESSTRDSCFVRYECLIDRNADNKGPEDLIQETFFGELQRVVQLDLPKSSELHLYQDETIVLAHIRTCNAIKNDDGFWEYTSMNHSPHFVDLKTIACVVGRVRDRGCWAFVDRSGPTAHAKMASPPSSQCSDVTGFSTSDESDSSPGSLSEGSLTSGSSPANANGSPMDLDTSSSE